MEHSSHAPVAGVVAALVGFTSSFAVVLAGLTAVGATPAEAGSGLAVLCLVQGVGVLWLTLRHRTPLLLAWSTPGAAMLAATGAVAGGWPAAIGAFLLTGALILLTGVWSRLGALIAAIPPALAQAMLAGVVLTLCLAPVHGLSAEPWAVGPIVLCWLVALRLAKRWAVPVAFAATLVVVGIDVARAGGLSGSLLPTLDWTVPTLTWPAVLGIALPLYVVTMAGQNVPGTAVMASYGYRVPWRETMTVTGLGTVAGATFGGHAVNLAAITASMTASPDVHPDPRLRWRAAHAAGWTYLVLAVLSTPLTTFVSAAPPDVVGTVAGLALLATLASALHTAMGDAARREAAAITFVVAAAGGAFLGIGAAFWALAAGLGVDLLLRHHRRAEAPGSDA
ncbi:benzoate/H(+) symporter BenE family transporter [Microlunatus ginsengisoli]|uniref:Benzoate/H(+) symporter BenE family transporter n=1 Tax=Microlunatus ginsengisoli TaxID=363863 RepID=A0ABP7AB49_9ACTN